MGKLTRLGYTLLDELIADRGHEWLHTHLLARLFDGDRPSDVAASLGVPYVVLRGWIEEHCPEDVLLAGRARADELEWKATNAVDNAVPEEVAVAKLKADHYMKVAAKLDRAKWGDKDMSSANSGVTIVLNRGLTAKARGGVIEIGADADKGDQQGEVVELVSV